MVVLKKISLEKLKAEIAAREDPKPKKPVAPLRPEAPAKLVDVIRKIDVGRSIPLSKFFEAANVAVIQGIPMDQIYVRTQSWMGIDAEIFATVPNSNFEIEMTEHAVKMAAYDTKRKAYLTKLKQWKLEIDAWNTHHGITKKKK